MCPQLGRNLWGQVDEIEGKVVSFGESIEYGRRKFIARKLWIKDHDAFSGQRALPEHHGCSYTFAGAGRAYDLCMSLPDALPRGIDRFIVAINVQTYEDALLQVEKLPWIVLREFIDVFHGLADIG